ncbi:glycerol-3-phosphate dehydrogenase [Gymnodinialimonas sp. 2305UL16-5]|uniref:glycerol-3-phosphate dehydrogenase n=1 Tax=Gymnodinialimonas mytili TaxID=3126503 RepID=UPI0030A3D153
MADPLDVFIVGGGINGCGIARDAAGRGYSVALAEMNDFASATSSGSTKLFHGGLRYLEFFEFRLVREALIEREILLKAMPHIAWPMRFVLPYHRDMRFDSDTPTSRLLNVIMPWMRGRRPAWLIRLGLFLYDHMGGRQILPATASLDLRMAVEGQGLARKFERAFEYSDCWVEDARLVILNARDAEARGAMILPRTQVLRAERAEGLWRVETLEAATGAKRTHFARALVNAAGPWVSDVVNRVVGSNSDAKVRLVRGSHIVTRRLFDHDKCYFFQGTDGRIIFAIPYETNFTLIGTTDADHPDPTQSPTCTPVERDYLLDFVNQYLRDPIDVDDIVWTYSGVRPLYDDGASTATAATRDYVLKLDAERGAPVLNVFGGKITTYRKLAESALLELDGYFKDKSGPWTAGVPLPGGDFAVSDVDKLTLDLATAYPFLDPAWCLRMIRAYGTEAQQVLGDAHTREDLGLDFGATLTEREVGWMIAHEYAQTAEDIIWRRSKLGLHMTPEQIAALETWMTHAPGAAHTETRQPVAAGGLR